MPATPNTGPAGSWHVNPGSEQMRYYGADGLPALDSDFDHPHPGVGSPHRHIWIPDAGGFPVRQAPVRVPDEF